MNYSNTTMSKKLIKVTIVGGGTGTYVVTSGLKHHQFEVSKVVTVFDSGGSSARLRDEFGFLPVGDLRQSLAALAHENGRSWIRDLLLYRFSKGEGLSGHNLGNLILTALQDMTGSTPKALNVATNIFRLQGRIYPVSTDQSNLEIHYADGTKIIGEDHLDDLKTGGRTITKLKLTKRCNLYSGARAAIKDADYIIIGPGDLYASILPNFIVSGAKVAVRNSQAKLIYIVNLMTRYTQTHQFSALDHVQEIEKYAGRPLDYIFVNAGSINPKILKKYAASKEFPVEDNLPNMPGRKIIRGDFASSVPVKKQPGDRTPRSLMRHDQDKITQALLKILK